MTGWVRVVGGGGNGFVRLASLGRCVAALVDDDVVVVPTQCDEVVGIGGPAIGPVLFVMGLQPVSAGTSGGGATAVASEYEPA